MDDYIKGFAFTMGAVTALVVSAGIIGTAALHIIEGALT
jgi:hypothetical protein